MRWISVNYQLPEDWKRVLVHIDGYPDATIGYRVNECWLFVEEPFKDNKEDVPLNVLYWADIPKTIGDIEED